MRHGSTSARPAGRRTRGGQAGVTLTELLVVMSILSVVSVMIILGWAAATQSISYSSNSAYARDQARYAVGRLTREIRDAQAPTSTYLASAGFGSATPSMIRTRQSWMMLSTSFNVAGSMPSVSPRIVVYCLYADGKLWRYADANGNGKNDATSGQQSWATTANTLASMGGSSSQQAAVENQAKAWEGASVVVDHVVNGRVPDANVGGSTSTDVFRYSYYDSGGTLVQTSPVLGDTLRAAIIAVQVHLLVDLNPDHSPAYIDLQTTAQLRNAH